MTFSDSMPADTLFVNANILTLDADNRVVRALAVRAGNIVAAGTDEEVRKFADQRTQVIDLEGRTVLPGFIDGHAHPTSVINAYKNWLDGRFPTTPSIAVLLQKIKARAAETKAGEWILVAGTPAGDTRFVEKRLPTRAELDAASSDAPVLYFSGMHKWVASSQGLKKLGIASGMKELKGALIELDDRGEPTGMLSEPMALVPGRNFSDELLGQMYARDIPAFWNSRGYTSLLAITPQAHFEQLKQLSADGAHGTLRYCFAVNADPAGTLLPPTYGRFHLPESADAAWYRFAGVKLWVDGDVPAKGGYVYQPYCGEDHNCGVANISPKKLVAMVSNIRRQGLGVFLHATGDRATDMAVDAFEQAQALPGPRTLQRIEHFGDFMLTREQMLKVQRLGILGNCQPGWIYIHANATSEYLGQARASALAFQFRTMVEAGLQPGFGSDLTGIVKQTEDPFFHIWCAVTRAYEHGTFVPEQAVSLTDALRMMTIWAARAQGEGELKGSLEIGKFADMVVLSDDITRIAPAKIADLCVLQTIVGGKIVYQNESALGAAR
jgi:predicted amidohydrolase YtcJ